MTQRRQSTGILAAWSVAALLTSFSPAESQVQTQPGFRSGTQVVQVDVRIFDKRGNFVTDIDSSDFEVYEDGVLQRIVAVTLIEDGVGTVSRVAPPDSEAPSLDAPAPAAAAVAARQTWIFAFDLNHLSPGAGFDRAREAVETFIETHWRDGDMAGVLAGPQMVNNRLTSNRDELLAAVRSVRPNADRRSMMTELTREWPRLRDEGEAIQIARNDREALQRAVIRACQEDPDACRMVPPDAQLREKARRLWNVFGASATATLTAMNALASGLARVPGPKTVVFLSDGFVAEQIETTLRNVVGQVARAGARVYAIDVRGLNRGRGAGIIDQAVVSYDAGAPAAFDSLDDGPNSLAVDTGGMMFRNENNIGRALSFIAADANRYYVVGYQSSNSALDGSYRNIEVRVKRENVQVRARRGYLALAPAQMLTPQPIRPPGDDEAAAPVPAAPPPPDAETPVDAAHDAVAPPASDTSSGAVRLRPDAVSRVRALSDDDSAGADTYARQGWEAYQRGDVEAAYSLLRQASEQGEPRPWALYALGMSEAALGKAADAVLSWERVRTAAPDFFEVYMDLADTYFQLGHVSQSLLVLRAAAVRWPTSEDVHNAIGVIHVSRDALDEAIAAFTLAVDAAPDDALSHLNLGKAYELRYSRNRRFVTSQRRWVAPEGDRRKAMEAYRRCVALGGPYAVRAESALSALDWQLASR